VAEIGIPYVLETPRGDLFFNGYDQDPANGFLAPYYRLTEVEGLDGPAIRTPNEPRPQRGGLIAFPFLEGGMFPALSGTIVPTDLTNRRELEDKLKGHFRSMLDDSGMLIWRPTGAQFKWSLPLDVTDAQTDATRAAATDGDGIAAEGSVGAWEATTNLITNGGCETNATGWNVQPIGTTISRVTTAPKFGSAHLQVVTPGSGANEGAYHSFVAAGSVGHTVSAWVRRSTGGSTTLRITVRSSAGALVAAGPDVVVGNTYVRLTLPNVALNNGTTYRLAVETSSTNQAATFYVDGAQAEAQPIATPYVETNGATAARTRTIVEGDASAAGGPGWPGTDFGPFSPQQGWAHFCFRPEWSNVDNVHGGARGPLLFSWYLSAAQRLEVYFKESTNNFQMERQNAFGTDFAATGAATFSPGDIVHVTVYWTPTEVGISLNGGAFSHFNGSHVPTLETSFFYLGSSAAGGEELDGRIMWAALGLGRITNDDAAALASLGADDSGGLTRLMRGKSLLSEPAQPTVLWTADDATYFVQQERRVGVRAYESAQIKTNGVLKDFRLGMIAADPVIQSEVEYMLSDITGPPFSVDLENTIDGDAEGLADVYPVVRVTCTSGTLTNVDIQNDDAGKKVRLLGLGLVAGQWVEVNMLNETVLKSDGTDLSGKIDIATSEFWYVTPGHTDTISLQNISGTVTWLNVFWRYRFAG
jgi:hypothetical protein